jgi:hypothetical protein
VELGCVEAVPGAGLQELAIASQVLVVAGVEGVVAALWLAPRVHVLALAAELQGEEGVLAPGYRCVHVDLVLRRAEVGEAFATGRAQVHLCKRFRYQFLFSFPSFMLAVIRGCDFRGVMISASALIHWLFLITRY